MKKVIITLLFLPFVYLTNAADLSLIPYPQQVEYNKGSLILEKNFPVEFEGVSDQLVASFLNNQLNWASNQSVVSKNKALVKLSIVDRGDSDNEDWYSLEIDKKGVLIKATTSKGLLYGIESLNQILYQTNNEGVFELPYVKISDNPAYAYRGFMLDSSRHIQSVEGIKAVLDFMVSIKLNVFHWHLTDDDGYRIESKKFPRMNQVGSYINQVGSFIDGKKLESNGYYTIDQIHDILAYAKQRHIEVIPEFDVPGHNWALLTAYPEFRCPNAPDANAVCGGNEEAFEFVKSLFDEIIEIFKPQRIHIGGDERKKELWNNCPLCKAKMSSLNIKDEHGMQNYYLNELSKHIHSRGVTTIAWAENLEGGIPEGQITQAWRKRNEAATAIGKNHQVIVSDNGKCYLDYPENAKEKETKPKWMPILSVEKVYNFDFIPENTPDDKVNLILGGECPLWTEQILENSIYPQIGKRIEAHAERSWTSTEKKNYERFSRSYEILEDYFKDFYKY